MFNITTPPNGTPSKIEGELCFGRSCPLWSLLMAFFHKEF